MKGITKVQEQILQSLKKSYDEMGGGPEGIESWKKDNGEKLAELVADGVPFYKIVSFLKSSRGIIGGAIKEAGFVDFLPASAKKALVPIVPTPNQNEEDALISELKNGYTKAKKKGPGAVNKWSKRTRRQVRRLRKISKKGSRELSKLIGCSEIVFRYDQRKESAERKPGSKSKQTGLSASKEEKEPRKKATRGPTEATKPPVPPQKFGPKFWQGLAATGTEKVGDVMVEALKSLLDQLADRKEETAKMTKERDECRAGWKAAEARATQLHNEVRELRAVKKHRDQLLSEKVQRALVRTGDKSLNDTW